MVQRDDQQNSTPVNSYPQKHGYRRRAVQPEMPGGESGVPADSGLPGARLAADVRYMDADSATRANKLIESWREMPRSAFEASASRL